MSRIDPIMKRLIGNESADDLATDILEVLTEGSNIPQAGNYYVFVYQAKWKAAREYCAARMWEFKVITEKELDI